MSVRDRFILDTLKRSGDELMTRQGQAIAATVKTKTGQMLSSRSTQVYGGDTAQRGAFAVEPSVRWSA